MFEKIIILLLFIILFVYIYIIKKYKNNITNDKKNILLFKYDYFSVKVFIYFLIPFYILKILAITIFWKTDSIDKISVIMILFLFLVMEIIFVLFILKKKIVMEESLFIYSTLFFTKKIEYKGLQIYFDDRGNTYIYKNKRKLLKLIIYIKNFQLLEDKIIKINGYECIKNINVNYN